jgi:hypothetical protein
MLASTITRKAGKHERMRRLAAKFTFVPVAEFLVMGD